MWKMNPVVFIPAFIPADIRRSTVALSGIKGRILRGDGFSGDLRMSFPSAEIYHSASGKPRYDMAQYGVNYNPEWPIRVNIDHILGDAENVSRLPGAIRQAQNLPLLLETAVELARRKAAIEPGIVVPQGYQGKVQYLLPLCLMDMEVPDLAMTLTIMDGYYLGNTCLTLEMAYLNARVLARPIAPWLTGLVA